MILLRPFLHRVAIIVALLCSSPLLWADTSTLNFDIGVVRDRTGTPVAADTFLGANNGTLGVLVASASGTFLSGNALLGSILSKGNTLGGTGASDNTIVATFHAVNTTIATPTLYTQFAPDSSVTTIDSSLATANTKLQLYWFPGITADGTTLSLSTISPLAYLNNFYYGSYRSSGTEPLSDISWVVPASGATNSLIVIDPVTMFAEFGFNTGVNVAVNDLTALYYIAVPEPTSLALMGGGLFAMGAWVRRRRVA